MDASSFETIYSRVDELLLNEACEDDPEAKSRFLKEARAILVEGLIQYPDNPDLHHLMGLCWYYEPELSDDSRTCIVQSFENALKLKPDYHFASLYLGHFYFDEGRYAEALQLFSQVDEGYFESIPQPWRVLKNRELVLCCRLYLDAESVQIGDIDRFCLVLEAADNEDVMVPMHLLASLASLEKHTELKVMAKRTLEMIARIGFENAKSIVDTSAVLRRVLTSET
jgi:Lipoprotein NlpI, contains TPR repeats